MLERDDPTVQRGFRRMGPVASTLEGRVTAIPIIAIGGTSTWVSLRVATCDTVLRLRFRFVARPRSSIASQPSAAPTMKRLRVLARQIARHSQALAELRDERRAAVKLARSLGVTWREIGEALNMSMQEAERLLR